MKGNRVTQSLLINRTAPKSQSDHAFQEIHYRKFQGLADFSIIAEIGQRYWDSIGVDEVITPDEVALSFKHMEHFNPRLNVLIAELEGQPIGYTQVNWSQETDGPRIYRHITRVTPEGLKQGVHDELLKFSEGRLRLLAQRHPAHIKKYLSTGSADRDPDRIQFLLGQGYQPERYFFEMLRPLDLPIPKLNFPKGIELRSADARHYRKILAALDEAFIDHWGHVALSESVIQWYFNSPDFQPHLWKVAWEGHEVVGMVLNYIHQEENQRFSRKRGYTEDICVRRPWRRQGIAKALIAESLRELSEQGMEQAALGVDTHNPSGALRLYQSLGYEEGKKFTAYRKEIHRS